MAYSCIKDCTILLRNNGQEINLLQVDIQLMRNTNHSINTILTRTYNESFGRNNSDTASLNYVNDERFAFFLTFFYSHGLRVNKDCS